MTVRARFIRSVVQTSKTERTKMPWTRGVVRNVTVAERQQSKAPLKVRTA